MFTSLLLNLSTNNTQLDFVSEAMKNFTKSTLTLQNFNLPLFDGN